MQEMTQLTDLCIHDTAVAVTTLIIILIATKNSGARQSLHRAPGLWDASGLTAYSFLPPVWL